MKGIHCKFLKGRDVTEHNKKFVLRLKPHKLIKPIHSLFPTNMELSSTHTIM